MGLTREVLSAENHADIDIESLRRLWTGVRSLPPEAEMARKAEAHNSFATALYHLIVHVGERSGLILDPDLDSFYLMDAASLALPFTLLHTETIAAIVPPAVASGAVDRAKGLVIANESGSTP